MVGASESWVSNSSQKCALRAEPKKGRQKRGREKRASAARCEPKLSCTALHCTAPSCLARSLARRAAPRFDSTRLDSPRLELDASLCRIHRRRSTAESGHHLAFRPRHRHRQFTQPPHRSITRIPRAYFRHISHAIQTRFRCSASIPCQLAFPRVTALTGASPRASPS